MDRHGAKGQRLVALFLFGVLCFNYPFLFVFSTNGTIFGIPILYVYMFMAWVIVIGLTAFVVETLR